ncbi:hypothetical protein [Kurthia senegalensis]|nr:hypothetical protein [Kurthia senegalensis]
MSISSISNTTLQQLLGNYSSQSNTNATDATTNTLFHYLEQIQVV